MRDGEGAQRLLETVVEGAQDVGQARTAAREIAGSLLVKAMVHGRDPNWGRVMMALGKSGIEFEESKVDLFINGIHIVHEGKALAYLMDAVVSAMSVPEVQIKADVNRRRCERDGVGMRPHGGVRHVQFGLHHVGNGNGEM